MHVRTPLMNRPEGCIRLQYWSTLFPQEPKERAPQPLFPNSSAPPLWTFAGCCSTREKDVLGSGEFFRLKFWLLAVQGLKGTYRSVRRM